MIPLLAALAPFAAPAAGVLSQGINAITQAGANRKNIQLAKDMYTMQRKDNLTDWERQNAYNHPAEQMKRFTEAGLNKNLIYGQQNIAQPVKSSSANTPTVQAPQFDGQTIVMGMLQAFKTQAETDNLREVNKNLILQKEQRQIDIDLGKFKLNNQQTLFDTTLEGMKYKNQLVKNQAQYSLDENERRFIHTGLNVTDTFIKLADYKIREANSQSQRALWEQQKNNLIKSGKLLDWEVELSKQGINRNDPLWARFFQALMGNIENKLPEPSEVFPGFKPAQQGNGKTGWPGNFKHSYK